MTRKEYNEYRYIKSSVKKSGMPTYGCMYTIPVDGTEDYKIRLDRLYSEWDLHPASVRVDNHYFDDKERIIYIKGRTWKSDDGKSHDWTELYTIDQRKRFQEALHQ